MNKKFTNEELINAALDSDDMFSRSVRHCMDKYKCDVYDAIWHCWGAQYMQFIKLTYFFNKRCKKYMHEQNIIKRKIKRG